MRKFSTYSSPNYEDIKDPTLLNHGSPDLVLLVAGKKMYVHAEMLTVYSPVILEKLKTPDPMWGKMFPLKNRSIKGVRALLDAIYPPQLIPPPDTFEEVYSISRELKMDLLIQKLKLGIIKGCCLEPLKAMQKKKEDAGVVLDAFAEFALNDLKKLDNFEQNLEKSTRLEICRRRAKILEDLLKNQKALRNVYAQEKLTLFRECQEPITDECEDAHKTGHGTPARTMKEDRKRRLQEERDIAPSRKAVGNMYTVQGASVAVTLTPARRAVLQPRGQFLYNLGLKND